MRMRLRERKLWVGCSIRGAWKQGVWVFLGGVSATIASAWMAHEDWLPERFVQVITWLQLLL
jgi:hypothetical protein